MNETRNLRLGSPTSEDRLARTSWNSTGDLARMWEVARVWRLGRRGYLLCADP